MNLKKMMETDINAIWSKLELPQKEKYSLIQHKSSNLWFIRDLNNGFGLLLSGILSEPSYKYENIKISKHNELNSKDKTLSGCILFQNKETISAKSFCDAVASELSQFDKKDFYSLGDIEEMFLQIEKITKRTKEKNLNEIIGVWGELFLLNEIIQLSSTEAQKFEVINAWESHEGRTRIDFNFKQNKILIEVKTTSNENRVHHINSIDQVKCQVDSIGYLASICIIDSDNGESCRDMVNKIKSLLTDESKTLFDGRIKIRGKDICDNDKYKFQINLNNKPKFYEFNVIPKPIYGDGIINIKWDIIINELPFISEKEKMEILSSLG